VTSKNTSTKWSMPDGRVVTAVPSTMPKGMWVVTDEQGNEFVMTKEDFAKCSKVMPKKENRPKTPEKTVKIVEKTEYIVVGCPMFLWGVAVGAMIVTWIFLGV
jgi:hypothetical protein